MTGDRSTALEASFVWLEGPDAPIHVGGVATFESAPLLDRHGRLRLDDLRERIGERLGDLPRLRQRLATVPLGLDRPRWVDDPHLDVARHVDEIRLDPPGDDRAFRALAGRLQSEPLPRDRPLWDLRFVTGLDRARVGLVERVHHAVVDGVSGVDVAALLLDPTPEPPARAPTAPWAPGPLPGAGDLLGAGLAERLADPVRALRGVSGAARRPVPTARSLRALAEGVGAAIRGGVRSPTCSLNGPARGPRALAWVRTDLAAVRAGGRAAGATANDVVLSAVAGGLRDLLLGRGEPLPPDLVLDVLVPVSRRTTDERGALGNRVGAIFAPLPVGIGDPAVRLARVSREMRAAKASGQGEATGRAVDAVDLVPARAAHLLARAVGHQRLAHLVVTNVPGPAEPLYMAGARMLEAFPVVPLGANVSLGVAALSYAGSLGISLTGDRRNCPDVDVMADGIARSLGELGVPATVVGAASLET